MKEEKGFSDVRVEITTKELKIGSVKYIENWVSIWENMESNNPIVLAKEMLIMGYSLGIFAGKFSDIGLEGFTTILAGIKMSMKTENRKEKITYGIWDKNGNLHTSEEGVIVEKGGDQ